MPVKKPPHAEAFFISENGSVRLRLFRFFRQRIQQFLMNAAEAAVAHDQNVVARLRGDFTVKRLRLVPTPQLCPENPAYAPIPLSDEEDVHIVGVVTTVIHTPSRNG